MGSAEDGNTDRLIRLTDGISLNDLISKGGTTFEVNFEDDIPDEQLHYDPQDVYQYVNANCLDLIDEISYGDGECEPFESLATKMTNLTEDGEIKKQIIREGNGQPIATGSRVTIDYNAYLEYNDEPFDSTYIRKKPFTFCLGDGQTVPGLDLGVQSMKVNEKARFLMQYTYAYGELGCLDRVPPKSTVLFEVEMKNCLEAGSQNYESLTSEEHKDFADIYKYCLMLCSKANDLFSKGMFKLAIREYNIATSKLEKCTLQDYSEQEKQQQLLLRILSNLVVAHTKLQQSKRACYNANKVINMCKDTSLKVPAKVYFNKARSLIELGDYTSAETFLRQARKLEPQNSEITKEFVKLDAKIKASYEKEKAIAKKMFKNNEKPEGDFQKAIKEFCETLLKDENEKQYKVPHNLTDCEREFVQQEAKRQGLEFKFLKEKQEFYVVKVA